jgi:hypothetical protein
MDSARVNSSSAENLDYAFKGCMSIQSIEIDVSSCTSMKGIFDGCDELRDVIINGNLTNSIDFSNTKLGLDSATEIVNNLPEVSGHKSLIFTNTPASKVNSISVAKAERKGWTIIR